MLKVIIKDDPSWHHFKHKESNLWFKGYLYNTSIQEFFKILQNLEEDSFSSTLSSLNGHFGFVYQDDDVTFAAVDRVRSIPIFYNDSEISSNPNFLTNERIINPKAILPFRMAGYTIGNSSLYEQIECPLGGHYLSEKNGLKNQGVYYQYKPWIFFKDQPTSLDLAKVTLDILKKTIDSLNGRQVIIPLSAGNDSRLIASGLKHLGYENVKCYSYGMPGNFEAKIAKIVADKLGYDFKFLSLSTKEEREFYRSHEFKKYLSFAESYVSVPYFQSISTISRLKNWIDSDAVFINGGTGDFISGGHISSIFSQNFQESDKERLNKINQANIEKNYSLWEFLKTKENIEHINAQLINEMPVDLCEVEDNYEFGLYEYSEFMNRQSKYVIGGQRAYEFYGYEWRLPLWDDKYLEFWERVPFDSKFNQKLYIDMLVSQNWGGVWDESIPVNKKTIRPLWVIPLRIFFKSCFIFFGKKNWHRFERIFLYYFMDVTRMITSIRFFSILRAIFKGPRHHVSWQAEEYVKSKIIK